MKRKYFSALLMGAMAVATLGTVTSCKDYDDDINNLQAQIDANSKAIKSIQDLISNGSVITSVASADNGVVVTLSNGNSFTIKNGNDGTKADVWTIGTDGYWYKNETKTDYYALGTKGDKGDKGDQGEKGEKGDKGDSGSNGNNGGDGTSASAIYYVPNAETGCFDKYKDGEFVEHTNISFRNSEGSNGISAVYDNQQSKTLTLTGVSGVSGGTVTISLDANLRSLVFMPKLYLDGIETIVYPYLQDTTLVGNAFAATESRQLDGAGNNKAVEFETNYWGETIAQKEYSNSQNTFVYGYTEPVEYHLNPSNANTVYADVKGYNVLEPSVIYYNTRAAAASLGVTSPEKYADGSQLFLNDNGILTAGLQIEHPELLAEYPTSNTYNNSDNTVALQVGTKDNNGNDATITSDYALLQPERAYLEGLAWANEGDYKPTYAHNETESHQQTNHQKETTARKGDIVGDICNERILVWDTAEKALKDTCGAALELYYDSQEGINISKYINIHYAQQNVKNEAHPYSHAKMSLADAAKYWGVTVEYHLVDYAIDVNKTHDSRYAKWVDQANGIVRAWNIKYDGTTPQGETSQTAVDREPLVQVLVKNADGEVVLDGYILLHITTTPPEDADNLEIASYPAFEGTFDLCNAVSDQTTWAQFSDYVLTQALDNMEKNTFDAQYKADVTSQTVNMFGDVRGIMKQYTAFTQKGDATAATPLGTIVYIHDTEGTTNHTFYWTLSEEELESLTHDTTLPVTISRYVRFVGQDNAKYPYLYIKLSWTLTRKDISKEGVITFGEKINNYWFTTSGRTGGKSLIRFDVQEPVDGKYIPTTTIDREVRSTLVGNMENTAGTHKYYFVPKSVTLTAQDGTVYTVTPVKTGNNGDKLVCKYIATNTHAYPATEEALNTLLNQCAIDYAAGAFNNTKLYANGTEIAELDPATGEILLKNNTATQAVLNAVGYNGAAASHNNDTEISYLRAWLGLVGSNGCGIAKQSNDVTFLVGWERPINLYTVEQDEAVDANTNGNKITILDKIKLYDWRGYGYEKEENTENLIANDSHMWGDNYWFWAYYRINGVTVDLRESSVLTNMHQASATTFVKLEDVTTQAELVFKNATGGTWSGLNTVTLNLTGYNSASQNAAIITYLEQQFEQVAVYYYNNGDNVTEFDVKIPVTISYQWGSFTDYIDLKIKTTRGN